ncbi:hypothetical protein DPX16_18159 [Anabarilius grahami]|uniref:Uncharacterized protein n=1 Tax=Anabarilius grahami TaxID=495550 RepID=A0A3N0YNV1_ANAGA|nr:hypothetical protein DPX16_18159 [Anabarilius grahami]
MYAVACLCLQHTEIESVTEHTRSSLLGVGQSSRYATCGFTQSETIWTKGRSIPGHKKFTETTNSSSGLSRMCVILEKVSPQEELNYSLCCKPNQHPVDSRVDHLHITAAIDVLDLAKVLTNHLHKGIFIKKPSGSQHRSLMTGDGGQAGTKPPPLAVTECGEYSFRYATAESETHGKTHLTSCPGFRSYVTHSQTSESDRNTQYRPLCWTESLFSCSKCLRQLLMQQIRAHAGVGFAAALFRLTPKNITFEEQSQSRYGTGTGLARLVYTSKYE